MIDLQTECLDLVTGQMTVKKIISGELVKNRLKEAFYLDRKYTSRSAKWNW